MTATRVRNEPTPSARTLAAGWVISALHRDGWRVRHVRPVGCRAHFALEASGLWDETLRRDRRIVVHGFHEAEIRLEDLWNVVAAKNDSVADAAVLAVGGNCILSHLAAETARSLGVEILDVQ